MIIIYHWDPILSKITGYKQGQRFEMDDLHDIIDAIIKTELNIMITHNDPDIVVNIDGKWKFKQH